MNSEPISEISDLEESENELSESDESENFREILKIYKKGERNSKLPADISDLMGLANHFYIKNDWERSKEKSYEIIQQYPNFSEPYKLLAKISEKKSDFKRAADFYTLSAQCGNSDSDLWEKIGRLYKRTKCYDRASYSFGRALKSDPLNKSCLIERAECLEISGDIKKAIKCLEKLLKFPQPTLDIVKKCAKLYAKINQFSKSIENLSPFIYDKENGHCDFNIINMISQLYIQENKYDECSKFIEKFFVSSELTDQDSIYHPGFNNLPLEIVALYASCQKNMKKMGEAAKAYDYIISSQNHQSFLDILEQAANFYEDLGENNKALEIFEKILNENNNEETILRCGILYKKIGDIQSAIDAFKTILESNPKLTEAKIHLSNIYMDEGNKKEALRILDQYIVKKENNEEVFFSEEEGVNLKEEGMEDKKSSEKIPRKSKKIYKKIITKFSKHVKFEDENEPKKLGNDNEEFVGEFLKNENEQGIQSFGEKIELSLEFIKKNYDVDDLRLKFIQAQILLKENSDEAFLEKIFKSLIISLKMENEIQILRQKILNRYLFESRKKTFKKTMKSTDILKQIENNKTGTLLKTKKQKNTPEFLMKKKTKISKLLTDQQLEKISHLSKLLGKDKYFETITKVLDILHDVGDYEKMMHLCQNAIKLDFLKEKEFENQNHDLLLSGVISTFKMKEFNQSFYYIKRIARKNPDNYFIITILSIILKNIEDPQIYRTFILKLSKLSSKHLIINQILGNSYLQSGYYDLAIKSFYNLHREDPLNSLINLDLATAFLQSTTSRTTLNKVQSAKRAFYFLQLYKNSRESTYPCETYYNIGRAYAQLSMFSHAIKYFEKSMNIYNEREFANPENFQKEESYKRDNLFKECVYNLVVIHKKMGNKILAAQLVSNFLNL